MSVRQAEEVAARLDRLGLRWNGAWSGGPAVVDRTLHASIELAGAMKVTLLSPRPEDLDRLAKLWAANLKRAEPDPDADETASEAPTEDAVAGGGGGLAAAPATAAARQRSAAGGPIDVEGLAGRPFVADRSVANNASIAFLAERHGQTLLVGGDASADVLAESIRALISRRGVRRLRVDAFVVPHNGSARNLHRGLLELVDCDRYLIATNGALFNHPHRETVARILAFGRSDPNALLTLVFNYRTPLTSAWDDLALQSRWKYRAIYPERDGGGIKVQI